MIDLSRRIFGDRSFTKSNGSPASKVYERLTKASRRSVQNPMNARDERFYRKGLYDAYKALQEELTQ